VIVLNENKHSLDHSLHPHDLLILPSDVKALSMASRALETPDIFDPLNPLDPLDPVDALDDLSIFGDLKSHYCSIQEGPPDKKEMDTPWQERLHAFLEKRKEVLTLSSFDLMNPESRSVLRDAVHSAFTGQLLINGQRYCLEKGRQRVEVVGGFIPKCTQKLAQVFQSYSALPTPKVETRTLSPEEAVPTDKKALYDALLSTSPIFLTDSRRTLIYQVDLWYQESSPLYPLFIIEGPSGIGKSAVMREYLERVIPTEKLLILGPTENLVTQLDAANRKEQLVFIDELNTLREDQLEAIEALIRSRPKLRMIGTQNPISFAGRKKLSAQLLQHAAVFHLQEYKTEELMALLASTGIPSEKAELWIHAFQEEQEKNKVTFRDFLSHVRSLSKGPVMQSSGGSSSLSLVFHSCTEKAPTKETHGSKKSSKGIKRSRSPE
jgi:hypothetical protein